jgi:hypothetical protein
MLTRDVARVVTVAVLILSISSLLYTTRSSLWYPNPGTVSRPFKAALIDEATAFIPDPAFNTQVTSELTSAGYKIDYFPPSTVTVQLFKDLPSMGYGIVIIRNHSTGSGADGISIVTSELYDPNKYVFEQLTGQIAEVSLGTAGNYYFSITPLFVRESMQGFFPGSVILMMGCTGLANSEMAQAFVTRGAQVYVSWDHVVQAYRTDVATTIFWQWMTGGHSIADSAAAASQMAPADPVYHSLLAYYPINQGTLTLP